ncbi:MAG: AAA family ATPase [Actinomycetota bacterium]|nr:AAA family ATPase [Actinomycetota bacterium]
MERDDEFALLDAALDSARSGAGATVLIEGPAGIGKTSLLASVRERSAIAGMAVLHGSGSPLEREYAMGVVRQCLEPAVRDNANSDGLFGGAARLAQSAILDIPADLGAAPAGVLHGLYWLTANLADRAPLLLAVDDAHWADEPSLRFLAYLARRVQSIAVALVICTRVDEDGAGGALAQIRSDPTTEIVQPPPLGHTGVEALLRALGDGAVDGGFARACHQATGGNPFLVGEVVRALRARGVPFTAAGAEQVTQTTPPTVARSVRATLDRLGPAARALARAAAVLGDDVDLGLAAELADLPLSEAAPVAGDLTRAGIFDDAPTLRFRHPILSGAARADQSVPECAAAHARAAALLRTRGAGPERIALQLMHASPTGDDSVVSELRLAAERARARGAPGTAAALLRRAIAEPPATAAQADLLLALGQAEYAVGQSGEATAHLEQAHRAATDSVTRGRALLELFQASPGGLQSRRTLGPLVSQTLLELPEQHRELALRLRAIQIILTTGSPGDTDAARDAGRGLTGATPGEAVLLGHLTFVRMRSNGSAAEVAAIAEQASRQADALLEEGATALVITGIVLGLYWTDRLDAANHLLDRAVQIARHRGATADVAIALTFRASVHRRAGRLLDAEADARSALAAAVETAWSWAGRPDVVPLLASLIDQGRVQEAAQELMAAHPAEQILDAPPMTPLLLQRMRLRAAQGDHRRALDDWEEAVRRAVIGISPAWIEDLLVAADAHHALGDEETARALAAQAMTLARRWDTPGAIGQALHGAARLGGGDDAVQMLGDAVEQLQRSPARLELARALVTLGGLLRRRGSRVASREPLREGYELARACAAAGLAQTARAELRASGIRVHRETLSGVDALTASERRIAEMAGGGASNAEIAQALFLTVKTVEMHLTSAYRKLDIHTRRELPAVL